MPILVTRGDFPKKTAFELRVSGVSTARGRGRMRIQFPGKQKGTFKGWEVGLGIIRTE